MSSPHETTPLLQQPDAPTEASPRNTFYEPWTKSQKTTIVLVVLVMACFELAIVLIKLPSTYLFETGICRQYYSQNNPGVLNPDGSVDRDLCQLPHIQEDLSRLNTRFNTIETLLGLILALPYAALAQRRGARVVLMLSLVGFAIFGLSMLTIAYFWRTFSIETVVVSPLFQLIGGSFPMMASMTITLFANASPSSKRLTVFFLTGSSELVFQLLAAFVAAVFLARELVKTAILVGTGVLIPALVLLYFVPFDTPRIMSTHAPDSASSELLDTGDARSLKYRINEKIRHYTRLLFPCSVLKPGVLELLGTIFIMNLARQIQIPLVRSMPNKLGWTSYQTNLFINISVLTPIVLLLVILPVLNVMLHRVSKLAPYRADFSMAIIGLAALLFSALIMSLSLATIPFILGFAMFTIAIGAQHSLQSFVTWMVDRERILMLYVYVDLITRIGRITGSALINGALKDGIYPGDGWFSLPFFLATGAFAISLIYLLGFRRWTPT